MAIPPFEVLDQAITVRDASENMEALRQNEYPGRFIGLGVNPEGTELHLIAATMGRNPSSQTRVYVVEGDSIRTEALPSDKPVDPLTLYRAMTAYDHWHIATNGDQTDDIFNMLASNGAVNTNKRPLQVFGQVLWSRHHEPDTSHTPRISEIVGARVPANHPVEAGFSVIRNNPEDPDNKESSAYRFYKGALNRILAPGTGLSLHTYQGNDDPLQAFEGAPRPILIGDSAQATAELFAETLDESGGFLVSAVAKAVDIKTGRVTNVHVLNKFGDNSGPLTR